MLKVCNSNVLHQKVTDALLSSQVGPEYVTRSGKTGHIHNLVLTKTNYF